MILSKSKEDRGKALAKLLPHQKNEFVEIFQIMNGLNSAVQIHLRDGTYIKMNLGKRQVGQYKKEFSRSILKKPRETEIKA